MKYVLIVSGDGEYSDPWHRFAATSERLAETLDPEFEASVIGDVAETLSTLDPHAWDLVVLNFGSGGFPVAADAACVVGLLRYLREGGSLLACHAVAMAFPEEPLWEGILGGRWVPGTTMHPPYGDAEIELTSAQHPVTRSLEDFVVSDERYSFLRVSSDVAVLATHRHDGVDHAVVWAHEWHGARVVYDGLGHDARSYSSREHRDLVSRAARWLVHAAP